MTDKEIIIDSIKYFKQRDINKGLDEEHYVTEFHLLATHYNLLLEDYARKYNSLKEQLKRKEQALDEIENIIKGYCKNMCMAGTKETCDDCQNTEILNIINETERDNK